MITTQMYFGNKSHTKEQQERAAEFLPKVNALLYEYQQDTGNELEINPVTGTIISGSGNGGFRLPDCTEGAPSSSHKEACGVDLFDPGDHIDTWITDEILEKHGLYREHPDDTYLGHDGKPHPWCHLTDRAPHSGKRTFKP